MHIWLLDYMFCVIIYLLAYLLTSLPTLLAFANLSFNFNYNLVIAEISFTLQFSNPPPTHRKSSDNCDISAVTDQMLLKI